ncbi:MAG: hypothetical protein HY918_02030 [Candidatus Doudnabacteria bacterium]|nr:hypothetical protein [Candidatus Doudnabacteria bacterium]
MKRKLFWSKMVIAGSDLQKRMGSGPFQAELPAEGEPVKTVTIQMPGEELKHSTVTLAGFYFSLTKGGEPLR